MKWLILRANVTNRGKKIRNLEGNQYVVLTDTGAYQFDVTLAEWELAGKKAAPGETVTGWLVFRIPSSVRNATLSVKDSLADDYAVSFSHDNGLDVGIPK